MILKIHTFLTRQLCSPPPLPPNLNIFSSLSPFLLSLSPSLSSLTNAWCYFKFRQIWMDTYFPYDIMQSAFLRYAGIIHDLHIAIILGKLARPTGMCVCVYGHNPATVLYNYRPILIKSCTDIRPMFTSNLTLRSSDHNTIFNSIKNHDYKRQHFQLVVILLFSVHLAQRDS